MRLFVYGPKSYMDSTLLAVWCSRLCGHVGLMSVSTQSHTVTTCTYILYNVITTAQHATVLRKHGQVCSQQQEITCMRKIDQ